MLVRVLGLGDVGARVYGSSILLGAQVGASRFSRKKRQLGTASISSTQVELADSADRFSDCGLCGLGGPNIGESYVGVVYTIACNGLWKVYAISTQ